ncbi:MAG: M36 family metallopeptidase [Saprospiraceae bacterium]
MKKFIYTFLFSLFLFSSSNIVAQSLTPLDKAMAYVETNAEKWGLEKTDFSNTLISDMYTNNKTGVTYIYLIQGYNNIPVNNAITSIAINKNGKLVSSDPGYIIGLKNKINTITPTLAPMAAIKSTVAHLGIKATYLPVLQKSNPEKGIYNFGKADFSENEITVSLTYIAIDDQVKLAWSLAVNQIDNEDYYNTFVDATNGEVISKYNYTNKCTVHQGQYANHKGCKKEIVKSPIATYEEAATAVNAAAGTYNVFALPIESPLYGERELLVDPYFTDSSPYGWHDSNGADGAEDFITRGNNVHAFLDKENSGFSLGDEPDGGDALVFDFPYDINSSAEDNEQGATVNLFYMVNMMHDITKRLGFDEQAGNFQINNYGNGGNGGDQVLAQASDGIDLPTPTLDNANFATPPDGGNGEMQMFLWTNPSGILSIDAPTELSGFVNDVGTATGQNGFGAAIPTIDDAPISGKLVVARSSSASSPTTCCTEIVNGDEINGNIALIDRGLCDFSLKAYHAQQAGAISVIICNVVGGGDTDGLSSFGMSGGDHASEIDIVPLSLGKTDCDVIRASLLSNIDVQVTIQSRPPMGPEFLDGAVDNGIIAHEYGHGISNRIIGGPSQAGCLTSDEQAGEGISDYFSLVTTVEDGDMGTDLRGIGNYADGKTINGRGIRRYPYSTDIDASPLVYNDIIGSTSQYDVGEVWTNALWEVYWNFVDKFGLDINWEDDNSGNYKAVKLTIEGMKISGCNPSLIDLRNGILNADTIFYNGENASLIWAGFAKRGFGYLANDGGTTDDRNDGEQNFDPEPLSIAKLKVQKSGPSVANAGDEITITLTAQNHIPETRTGVKIIENIPEGLTYVEGSASVSATLLSDFLTLDIGTMEYKDEVSITYKAIVDATLESETLFYDNIENPDFGNYDFGATESFTLWQQSYDVAHSGDISWWASQEDSEVESDFYMDVKNINVVGERPVLRFVHRYDTETGSDGGFIQVSVAGSDVFEDVKQHFIHNGYPIGINYTTFAIPSLEGFSGTSNDKFISSYLDLSAYNGKEIIVRFRFGTNATGGVTASNPGWFVDDIEIMDLNSFNSIACIVSDSDDDECTRPLTVLVNSNTIIGTNDATLDNYDVTIAPNPTSDYVTVAIKANKKAEVQLSITTVEGKLLSAQNVFLGQNEVVRTIDVSSFNPGIYFVKILSDEGIITRKIIVQ